MDSTKLIFTGEISPPVPLEQLAQTMHYNKIAKSEPGRMDGMSEENKKQAATNFEAVFISKLLDQMRNTIGQWGFEKDGVSKQVQGMFSLYLSQHIADNGGFGLWKDIYRFLSDRAQGKTTIERTG